ncbi:MAG: biotin synthase BioB [Clostridium sp.]|nr:biotin synthase BioB [Clostridium sp.]
MMSINDYIEKIKSGIMLDKEDALKLAEIDIDKLCKAADELRKYYCGNQFDICTIINGKSGRCSENCKFCAQSSHYETLAEEYPLLETEEVLRDAKYNYDNGIHRYSVVTSGRKLSDKEVDKISETYKVIKRAINIELCASHGLLTEEQFKKLKDAGVSRIHNNLETSRNNFSNVCTTHTFEDKIETIKRAQRAGLSVCSGGIIGMGETLEDRIDMALDIRALGIKSIPVNILNPIKGTPYEKIKGIDYDEICKTIAIFRFLIPDAYIRMAGGRGLLEDKGLRAFKSGANAAISGDMLTTSGITIKDDMEMLRELNYIIK